VKAILNERLWVPHSNALEANAREMYQFKVYDEKACERCEFRPERHCDVCSDCPAFQGETVLWKTLERGTSTWIGVPRGNRAKLKKFVAGAKLEITDRRGSDRMRTPLKFTGTLRDNQKTPIREAIEAGYGVLKAPPRAGKTVMAAAIACKMGYKTLILAAQQEWLDEFYRTFMGNDKIPAMTNAPEIAQFESTSIVGHCKTVEDFARHDVCLATYQTFITAGGRKKLKAIKSMFGLIVIDEVHGSAATAYARVLLGFNARHMIGLTGTDARKDNLYRIVKDIVGKVTATAIVQTLVPKVKIIETPASTTHDYKHWTFAMRYLSNHKERNALIVKHAVHDIRAGRSLVIPVTLVAHARSLADAINAAYGKNVATAFVSQGLTKQRRMEILEGARSYKIKCVVGIRSLVQTGINVPRWDTLYEALPISNVPKFTQETSRIRTVEDGKQPPMIKHFLEHFGPSSGCFRTCWWQTYVKDGFTISEKTKEQANTYLNKRKKGPIKSNFGLV
jgi:superfamily II DNA or RNA helicase